MNEQQDPLDQPPDPQLEYEDAVALHGKVVSVLDLATGEVERATFYLPELLLGPDRDG